MTGRERKRSEWTPGRIVGLYVLFGALWILFSDRFILLFVTDPAALTSAQTYKGWFFILVTAFLLYVLIRRMAEQLGRVRASLSEEEESARRLMDLLPTGLALCRMDGSLVAVNPVYAAIIGRTIEETLQLTYWDITPGKYAKQEQSQLKSLEETGRYGPYEKEYVHRDGRLVPVRLQGLIIEKGGEKFIWSSVEDISYRKKAEEALRKKEQVLRLFVEHTPAAIAMFDRDMRYVVASRRFLIDYDLGDRDIVGLSHYEVFSEIPERWREIHGRCLAGAVEKCDEDPFPRADGKMDWVRWEIRPWHEAGGKIGGVILFSEVITERKKAEMELEKHREHLEELVEDRTAALKDSQRALVNLLEDMNEAKKELEVVNERLKELDRLKSMFIASMSHELRTPLNSIIGFSGILLQGMSGELNSEQRDHLGRVFRAGKHLLGLITDVIDIAKIESGKITPFPEEFSINEAIDEACDSMRPQVVDKGLALAKNLPEAPVWVKNDRKRFLQCLLNFLSNAVKFTEKGAITVSIAETGHFVAVSVADTGIGIKDSDMKLLFQPFVRLESPLKITVPGTGLGLYLTRKLAREVLGGDVSAESREGGGSVFTLKVAR